MKIFSAGYSNKGQMKIQQMAFVLIAIMIFFTLVALFYFAVRVQTIEKSAVSLRAEGAKELVRKLASSPELSWSKDCDNCIDLDKAMMLKDRKSYEGFWKLDYLAIKKIYPANGGNCTLSNYPDCSEIVLIDGKKGIPSDAFVSLCRWEGSSNYEKCEIGRILASGKSLEVQNE